MNDVIPFPNSNRPRATCSANQWVFFPKIFRIEPPDRCLYVSPAVALYPHGTMLAALSYPAGFRSSSRVINNRPSLPAFRRQLSEAHRHRQWAQAPVFSA